MKTHKPPKRLLEAFEQLVEATENSKLSEEFFKNNRDTIEYLSNRLELTTAQTVLMALFIDKSTERDVSLSSLANFAGCRLTRLLQFETDLDELEKRRYIRIINGRFSQNYRVPKVVIKALSMDQPYMYQRTPVNDLGSFFDSFRRINSEKENDELTYNSMKIQTKEMLEDIPGSSLVRGLKKYKLSDDDIILFIYMAFLYVDDNNEEITFYNIEDLYDNDEIPSWCRRELRDRTSDLIAGGLIENSFDNGMARSDAFRLTEKAKQELLGDLKLTELGKSENNLIKHDTLTLKKLFYNEAEAAKIKELGEIISAGKFRKIQENLTNAGLRKGFCCLFYGAPGTGKTETVYQIAKATKRNIMQVDVDKIKSCWVGESEKNIKTVFERYRNLCNDSESLPILLFNEADAILGIRTEGVIKAVDKMENSLQNIILQEMEKLEGIMIATTNLTSNLDKAFERRFLYKIKYELPGIATRMRIWRQMIPTLKRKEADYLSRKFELTGGEIENVVRKYTVSSILTPTSGSGLEKLSALCRHECISPSKRHKIGFATP